MILIHFLTTWWNSTVIKFHAILLFSSLFIATKVLLISWKLNKLNHLSKFTITNPFMIHHDWRPKAHNKPTSALSMFLYCITSMSSVHPNAYPNQFNREIHSNILPRCWWLWVLWEWWLEKNCISLDPEKMTWVRSFLLFISFGFFLK